MRQPSIPDRLGPVTDVPETDLWSEVHDERQALLDLLENLAPQEWDEQTLCEQWRVRDVVGHMISGTEVKFSKVLVPLARTGFRMNRFLEEDGRRRGAASPTQLLADFRAALPRTTYPPGQSPLTMLEDVAIHQIDIRWPLGRLRAVPLERMRLVAGYLDGNSFYPGKRLTKGLRLQATDTDWGTGDGPVVNGSIEALAMMLSGRFVALQALHGDGVATLTSRIRGVDGRAKA